MKSIKTKKFNRIKFNFYAMSKDLNEVVKIKKELKAKGCLVRVVKATGKDLFYGDYVIYTY